MLNTELLSTPRDSHSPDARSDVRTSRAPENLPVSVSTPEQRERREQSREAAPDTVLENPLEYAARVIREVHDRLNGCMELTNTRIDEIAKDVGITPLQMHAVLEAMGLDRHLAAIHQQMQEVAKHIEDDLDALN